MAYKYKDRYLKVGSSWQDDDGFKHPFNWQSSWSAKDLKKWGLTGKQMINRGLKYQWIERTKSTANGLLTVSDWYVTRKSETDTAIPNDILKYRADVRTATKTIEDKINACTKLTDFMKLFDTPVDKNNIPTGKAPIYDFPDEV